MDELQTERVERHRSHERMFDELFTSKVGWPTFSLVVLLLGGAGGWLANYLTSEVSFVRSAQADISTRVTAVEVQTTNVEFGLKAANAKLDRLLYLRTGTPSKTVERAGVAMLPSLGDGNGAAHPLSGSEQRGR